MGFRDEFANTKVFYFGAIIRRGTKASPGLAWTKENVDYSEKQTGKFSGETFPPLEIFSWQLVVPSTSQKYCRVRL